MEHYMQLIDAQDEYIKLLGKEINSLVGIAHIHHWQSENAEDGNSLRKKIELIRAMIPSPAKVEQDGPWKVVSHHEAGVPESGCSGDNYVTITDGKVSLYFNGGIDDDDEQRLCNILNQLKIKLDYDHSAEFVASEMEKMYKDACDEIRRLKEQDGLRWVKASVRYPQKSGIYFTRRAQVKSCNLLTENNKAFWTETDIEWLDESASAKEGEIDPNNHLVDVSNMGDFMWFAHKWGFWDEHYQLWEAFEEGQDPFRRTTIELYDFYQQSIQKP